MSLGEHHHRTSLVGRTDDLEKLREALASGFRLIIVCGPPGVGKTRLATESLHSGIATGNSVATCCVEDVTSPAAFCARIAEAFGAPALHPGENEAARLGRVLRACSPLVLLVDGFDRLVDSGASLLAGWLRAAPRLTILVTSRERLHLAEETILELSPLATADAVDLFDEHARAVVADWEVAEHLAIVRQIVERLDCLPLAIGLAAARVDLMSPPELLDAIVSHRDALASRSGGAVHQATLESSIQMSLDGLTTPERGALLHASVFRGSFALEAAREVIDIGDDGRAVVDTLHALRHKSLLRVSASSAGARRFSLYATVRRVARQRLTDSSEGVAARKRHAAYYSSRCAKPNEQDLVEILAVAEEGVDSVPLSGLRATLAAEPFLWRQGRAAKLRALLGQYRDAIRDDETPLELRASALEAWGRARRLSGDAAESERDLKESLSLWTRLGRSEGRARALYELSTLAMVRSRCDEALRCAEESIREFRIAGDRRGEAMGLDALAGALYLCRESPEQVRSPTLRALRIARELGDRKIESILRGHLGLIALECGNFSEASAELDAALAIHRELGHVRFEAAALQNQGLLAREEGRLDDAERLFASAVEIHEEADDLRGVALTRLDWGGCREEAGDLDAAAGSYAEALADGRVLDDPQTIALALAYLGRVAARRGQGEEARTAFREAESVLATRQVPEAADVLAVCRAHLDDAASHPVPGSSARLGLRSAHRILEAHRGQHATLVYIDRDTRSFRIGGGRPVSLLDRPTLWGVLFLLAQRRLDSPGEPVDGSALFAAGWPDEQAASRSAAGRVRSAVYSLRQLGLREILSRSAEGYSLDPDAALRLE